jgi:head-tail adaptor
MTIEALYVHEFTLYRRTRTGDGHGSWEVTWPEYSTFSGRLRPSGASDVERGAQMQAEISHVLYAAADCEVQRGDRIGYGDLLLDVIAVRNPSYAGHHLEIDCQAMQAEGQP